MAANSTDREIKDLQNITYMKMVNKFTQSKAIDDTSLIILTIAYAVLIIFGVTGNGLVCTVVARKPAMRTGRNVYIINLAISDLLLCLITMPFSLVEISVKFWPLGGLLCKLVAGLQATSIFVSAISITAIALDRYQVIVNPTRQACHPLKTIITLTSIWILALTLASPLFYYRTVESISLKSLNIPDLETVDYCIEKWPMERGRSFYSVFSMIFQYAIPIVIVTVAYMGILRKLKHRMVKSIRATQLDSKKRSSRQRIRKTNLLLLSIAVIFGISWLPLNILNILSDVMKWDDSATFRISFAICHMIGMSSACSNPLLYGWLNENFKKEFVDIFSTCSPRSDQRSLPNDLDVSSIRPQTRKVVLELNITP